MYSTRTRVHARIPNGHPREKKRACRIKVRGQVGEDRRACPARGSRPAARAGHSSGEVRVGVGVGPVELTEYTNCR